MLASLALLKKAGTTVDDASDDGQLFADAEAGRMAVASIEQRRAAADEEEQQRKLQESMEGAPSWTLSAGYQRRNDSSTIVHVRQSARNPAQHESDAMNGGRGDVALGIPILRRGQRAIAVSFRPTAEAAESGGEVFIGMCDASAAFNDHTGGRAWGLRVRTGDGHVTPSAHHGGFRGRSLLPEDACRPRLQARGGISALECVMIVDMARRTLAFSINGAPEIGRASCRERV